jgi:hypothetical protein
LEVTRRDITVRGENEETSPFSQAEIPLVFPFEAI